MVASLDYHKSGTLHNTFIHKQSDTVYAVVLAADVEQEITIPAGANVATISATGNFYMKVDATAVVPTVTVTDGSASELNPTGTSVRGNSTMSFIAPTGCIITVMFFN